MGERNHVHLLANRLQNALNLAYIYFTEDLGFRFLTRVPIITNNMSPILAIGYKGPSSLYS